VVGDAGKVATSPDGITWTYIDDLSKSQTVFGMNDANSIIFANSRYWVVGDNCRIAASIDGKNWVLYGNTLVSSSSLLFDIQVIAKSPTRFYCIGNGGTGATSTNGITWTRRTDFSGLGLFGSSNAKAKCLIWANNNFYGSSETCIFSSPDGFTWTKNSEFPVNSIAWNGSKLCAVGNTYTCYTSSNGTTWEANSGLASIFSENQTNDFNSIAWGARVFCAVGRNGIIAISQDGTNWVRITSGFSSAVTLTSITWTGSQFCVVGSSGAAATSPDGITWTMRPGLAATNMTYANSVAWNGESLCVVGQKGDVATSYR
jgi:hypothetical protein